VVDAAQLSQQKHQDLVGKGVGLKVDLERSTAELQAARATLRLAEARRAEAGAALNLAELGVELTTLRAPVDGIIIEKKVVLGQGLSAVQPTPLFYIAADLQQMQVHAQIPEADIGKVQPGMKATFTVNDFTQYQDSFENRVKRFDGRVSTIRPMPTNLQGAVFFTAIIEVENQRTPGSDTWFLRPGMTVYLEMISREHSDVWLVPTEAFDVVVDEDLQSPEARKKREDWETRSKAAGTYLDWKPVWIMDEQGRPWPVFVRLGGVGPHGEPSFKGTAITGNTATFGEYQEVLEWDADPLLQRQLEVTDPAGYPQVITEAPIIEKHSLFSPPKVPRVF
jgi:hypothetical protein